MDLCREISDNVHQALLTRHLPDVYRHLRIIRPRPRVRKKTPSSDSIPIKFPTRAFAITRMYPSLLRAPAMVLRGSIMRTLMFVRWIQLRIVRAPMRMCTLLVRIIRIHIRPELELRRYQA